MKQWAFVSDFDGTISKKDYYWLVIEKYFPEGRALYKRWKAGELLDIDFLQTVFSSINLEEEKIIQDIVSLPIDEHVPAFIKKIQANGGDFYILSAGTTYYIEHLLKKYDLDHVTIYSNYGYFHKQNIKLKIDENNWHYSRRYGIDKAKVIQKLKEEYETIYFAGDSEPDSHPAKFADITFAKDQLISLLQANNIPHIPFEHFAEIEQYLIEHGKIKS